MTEINQDLLKLYGLYHRLRATIPNENRKILKAKGEDVLNKYFTNKAKVALSKTVITNLGENYWHGIYCIPSIDLIFINDKSSWWTSKGKDETLVHEYIHILDYKGFIDNLNFAKVLSELNGDEIIDEYCEDNYKYSTHPNELVLEHRLTQKIAIIGEITVRFPEKIPKRLKGIYSEVLKNAKA